MCLSCMLAVMCLIELSMHWKTFTHRTLCRVFVAYREEMTGTWINNYSPLSAASPQRQTQLLSQALRYRLVGLNFPSCHTNSNTEATFQSCQITNSHVHMPNHCTLFMLFAARHKASATACRKQILISGALHVGTLHPRP